MKTAISVPDELYERADAVAAERGMSRSQLYAQALQEYLDQQAGADDPVTAKIDRVVAAVDPTAGPHTARRLIEDGHWQW